MIAVSVTVLLAMMGMLVMQQAAVDVELAGGERAASELQSSADLGTAWAPLVLLNVLYPGGSAYSTNATPSNIPATLQPLSPSLYPAFCPENYCLNQPCPQLVDCGGFYVLGGPRTVGAAGTTVTMAVACTPNCSADQVPLYRVRSLGQSASGPSRLVEMQFGAR